MGRPRKQEIDVAFFPRGNRGYTLWWLDPATGRKRTRTAKSQNKKDLYREAAELQHELRGKAGQGAVGWFVFREALTAGYTTTKGRSTANNVARVIKIWEKVNGTMEDVSRIGAIEIGRFQAAIRRKSAPTRAKELRTLSAMLNWGKRAGYISTIAHIEMPPRPRGFSGKGRPISGEQFARLKEAVALDVGPDYAKSWQTALDGLWRSGLRVGELLALTWRRVSVAASGAVVIHWSHADQKSKRGETTPTTPDFAELVKGLKRRGADDRVFPVLHRHGEIHLTTFSDVISRAAKSIGEPITAHDLRRSFADRWARVVTPLVLSRLMRCSPDVIRKYYAELDSESISTSLMSAGTEKAPKTTSKNQRTKKRR